MIYLGLSKDWEEISLTESLTDSLAGPCLPDSPEAVILDTAQPHHALQRRLAVHRNHLHCDHLTVSGGEIKLSIKFNKDHEIECHL